MYKIKETSDELRDSVTLMERLLDSKLDKTAIHPIKENIKIILPKLKEVEHL